MSRGPQDPQHPPHDVEAAEQTRTRGRAPHNGDIEVEGNGHGPEEGAGVGEGGQGALQHAVPRGPVEVLQHPVEIREGGEEVGQREVEQELPGTGPQLRPQGVGAHQEPGAQRRQHARGQHRRPLRRVQLRGGQRLGHAGLRRRAAGSAGKEREEGGGEGGRRAGGGPGAAERPAPPPGSPQPAGFVHTKPTAAPAARGGSAMHPPGSTATNHRLEPFLDSLDFSLGSSGDRYCSVPRSLTRLNPFLESGRAPRR